VIYRSYEAFASDLSAGRIPQAISAIAYDPEMWSYTPLAEQQNPARYMQLFITAAKTHGYLAVMAPARDLMMVSGAVCGKRQGETLDQAFLRCQLPTAAAGADVLDLQAQAEELTPATYSWFVSAAASQVRAADAQITVVAELSTTPATGTASAAQLVTAAKAVSTVVSGYWLTANSSSDAQMQTLILTVSDLS